MHKETAAMHQRHATDALNDLTVAVMAQDDQIDDLITRMANAAMSIRTLKADVATANKDAAGLRASNARTVADLGTERAAHQRTKDCTSALVRDLRGLCIRPGLPAAREVAGMLRNAEALGYRLTSPSGRAQLPLSQYYERLEHAL